MAATFGIVKSTVIAGKARSYSGMTCHAAAMTTGDNRLRPYGFGRI
ncbi:MAG: hypothetical protein HY789_13925 [Deltaproteobacteria bacterium]|nr:hypothetical protein [Deltaproteobacteria bacterium]